MSDISNNHYCLFSKTALILDWTRGLRLSMKRFLRWWWWGQYFRHPEFQTAAPALRGTILSFLSSFLSFLSAASRTQMANQLPLSAWNHRLPPSHPFFFFPSGTDSSSWRNACFSITCGAGVEGGQSVLCLCLRLHRGQYAHTGLYT